MKTFPLMKTPPANQTSQHRGKALKIILGILTVIVIAIGLAIYFTQGIADTARAQLTAIKAGDLTNAYNLTSKAFQQQTSMRDFEKYINTHSVLKNFKDISFSERSIENNMGYLKGIIESDDGSMMTIEYQLVREDKQWRIQAFRLSEAGITGSDINTSSPARTANDGSGTTIHDVLVSDTADADGYVMEKKSSIKRTAKKIYVTAQLIAPNGNGKIEASLYMPGELKLASSISNITKSGNIMKAFSFTRTEKEWEPGIYTIVIDLSSGQRKIVNFEIE